MRLPRFYTDICSLNWERDVVLETSENVSTAPVLATRHQTIYNNIKPFKFNTEATPFIPISSNEPNSMLEKLDEPILAIQKGILPPFKSGDIEFNVPSQGTNIVPENDPSLSVTNVIDETRQEQLSNIDKYDPHKVLDELRTTTI